MYIPVGMHPTHLNDECRRQFKLQHPDWPYMTPEQLRTTQQTFKRAFMTLAISQRVIANSSAVRVRTMKPLTQAQIDAIKPRLVRDGIPVRFQEHGQTCNIETGQKQAKGINVIHQLVYWNFTKEVAREIAGLTGTKPIFSE